MEEDQSALLVSEGSIKSIKLSPSTGEEICTYSVNECPVTHPSQLGNPFLGLPLEAGKCESCGASENDKCEGHFGYIELPVPIYHPCHISELRQLLSLICLKCLRIKKGKVKQSNGKGNVSATLCSYCRDIPALSLKEIKRPDDDAIRLQLKAPHKRHMTERSWNFLDKYGFHHGGCSQERTLLPQEALNILKKVSDDTRRKLAARGYIVQTGYVMKYLPVPPNCLYIPEFKDGQTIMSYDISIALLKKVLQKIEQIKRSRSGSPNFEAHDEESCDLQLLIGQYIRLRGTTRNITCCANQTQTAQRKSYSGPTSPPSGSVKEKVKPRLDDGGVGFPPFRFGGGGGGGGGGGSSSSGGFILFVIVLLLDYLKEFERNLQNGPRRGSDYDDGFAPQ